MFKHILVAIDGSTYSQLALPAAIEVAKKFDSEILVFHGSEHDRGRAVVYSLETPTEARILVGDAVKIARQAVVTPVGTILVMASPLV